MFIKHPYLRSIETGDDNDGGSGDSSAGGEKVTKTAELGTEASDDSFKAPASQADLDRIVEARLARERAKFAGFDEFKEKAQQFDTLAAASQTDQEKAVAAAREEERNKITADLVPRLVEAEFKAAAKGVITDAALNALIEDLDLSKYVTDTGDVDEEKVTKKISAIATAVAGKNHQSRDLGQGTRAGVKSSGVASGAELFASTRK